MVSERMGGSVVAGLILSLMITACTAVGVALSGRPGYPGLHVDEDLA